MGVNEFRMSKVEQLGFLAQTQEEKEIALKAAEEIFAAESDEQACLIAEKYRKELFPFLIANIVDVIAIILKGGHIVKYAPDPKDISYLVFIPVPDPPNKKALVGHITKKQFHELCDKGIITERKDMKHTDRRGFSYSYYHLAEEIFYGIIGESIEKERIDQIRKMVVHGLYSVTLKNGYRPEVFSAFKEEQNRLFDNYKANI